MGPRCSGVRWCESKHLASAAPPEHPDCMSQSQSRDCPRNAVMRPKSAPRDRRPRVARANTTASGARRACQGARARRSGERPPRRGCANLQGSANQGRPAQRGHVAAGHAGNAPAQRKIEYRALAVAYKPR
eukprot:4445425-Prymnesium_polylepis.1